MNDENADSRLLMVSAFHEKGGTVGNLRGEGYNALLLKKFCAGVFSISTCADSYHFSL
jgi:hypothetical protein